MHALEIRNLSKTFNEFKAVDDISFIVPEGGIFGLLGRNGAGKTTTIRMLMNIYEPDSGAVVFRGQPVGQAFRDRVGYMPEERGLNGKMKVLDYLMFLAELKGARGRALRDRAMAYLEQFDLADRAHKKIEELSKGNQQKVQFISTILHDPEFIVLDEPFSGLDPVNTNLFKDIILELKRAGKAIIFSTHLMDFAERMCDHIALIHQGRLHLQGPLREVKERFSQSHVILHYEGDITFLARLPYVVKIQDFGNHAGIEIRTRNDSRKLLQDLLSHDVLVKRFDANDISLHDIFVSLTSGKPDVAPEPGIAAGELAPAFSLIN
jgi:ABC-2 type transport system ATP-binding protein